MRKRVTIQDIAKEVGVTHSTISRALRNDNRIGEDTRKRVHKTAEKMGYRHNRLAAGLKHGKTFQLGVFSDRSSWILGDPWDGTWLAGLHDAARKRNYRLLLNLPPHERGRDELNNPVPLIGAADLADGAIDGAFVLGGLSVLPEEIAKLKKAGVPLVFLSLDEAIKGVHQVLNGTEEKFSLALEELLGEGYEKIGLMGVAGAERYNDQVFRLFRSRLQKAGLEFKDDWFASGDSVPGADLYRGWEGEVAALMKSGVDAVVCAYGAQVWMIHEAASEKGIESPQMATFTPLVAEMGSFWKKVRLWEADLYEAGEQAMAMMELAIAGEAPRTGALQWRRRNNQA